MSDTRKHLLDDAISRLADLYEYGHLEAATTPHEFLREVREEVERLRAYRADVEPVVRAGKACQDAWELVVTANARGTADEESAAEKKLLRAEAELRRAVAASTVCRELKEREGK